LAHVIEALLHELPNLGLESAAVFRWQTESACGHPYATLAQWRLPF
jgi:hypothetical protein